nr:EOG090X0FQT [Eubosmina coregoni]
MADADQLKMEELDHEAYESENLQDTNDFSADNGATDGDSMMEDPELEAIKARVREMEEEAEKLKMLQSEVEKQINSPQGVASSPNMSIEDKMEVDGRSVFVGNVDYGATAEELEQHFHGCGSINRVTILCNKYDGHPKGFAYVEFGDKDSVQTAMALDESLFRGRQIKVMLKRTNRPGITSSNRTPRGARGARGVRGARPFASFGFRPMRRPRDETLFARKTDFGLLRPIVVPIFITLALEVLLMKSTVLVTRSMTRPSEDAFRWHKRPALLFADVAQKGHLPPPPEEVSVVQDQTAIFHTLATVRSTSFAPEG